MNKKSIKPSKIKALGTKIGVGIVALGLVAATVFFAHNAKVANDNGVKLSEDLAKVNAKVEALNLNQSSLLLENEQLVAQYNEAFANYNLALEELDAASLAKDEVLADYEALEAELETASSVVEFSGFDKDELSLDFSKKIVIDSNDLEKLGDYEISFDDIDIDVEETLIFKGAFASNDKDFEGETMYKLSEGDVKYKVSFSEDMSALDYDEDSVEFTFLGEDVEVVDWTSDSVKFETNSDVTMSKGDVVEGVELLRIGENAILVSFNGEVKSVSVGDDAGFKDLDVVLDSVFFIDGADDNIAVLKIGEDLDAVIEDGDEYEADTNYEWSINKDSIGLVLVEDFDEDDTALKATDSFVLPKDFAALSFELSEETMNAVDVEFVKADEVRFKGDFEDAEGTVTFNGTHFVDNDDEVFASLELKDSEFAVKFNGTDFKVGDISFPLTVDSLLVNGEDMTSEDVDVKSVLGIEVSAPQDDLEDGELSFEVPEEAVEATILVQ